MEAEKIIKEKEIVHEDEHKDYASKGVGNAGLTLGITNAIRITEADFLELKSIFTE